MYNSFVTVWLKHYSLVKMAAKEYNDCWFGKLLPPCPDAPRLNPQKDPSRPVPQLDLDGDCKADDNNETELPLKIMSSKSSNMKNLD